MISLTGILSLLSALAATSGALSCTECKSTTSSSCSGSSVTCPSGHKCGSSYSETNNGELTARDFVRGCTPSSHCDIMGSMSLQKFQSKRVSSCCNTDGCTPTIPSFPTQSSEPNRVVCPSCLSNNSAWCDSADTIQCKGNENMCLLVTRKTTGSVSTSVSIRGCATQSICDLGSKSFGDGEEKNEIKVTCTSGGISVHTVVLTPVIAGLLLLKGFF